MSCVELGKAKLTKPDASKELERIGMELNPEYYK